MPVVTMASCRVANAFSTRLKLIWPRFSLKTTKMSKKRIFCKKLKESTQNVQGITFFMEGIKKGYASC